MTTILRTLPTNIISVAKPSVAGGSGTSTVSTASSSPKQTYVIAAPGAGKQGTQAKIISSVPKLTVAPSSLIVSSAAGGVKSILSTVSADGKGIEAHVHNTAEPRYNELSVERPRSLLYLKTFVTKLNLWSFIQKNNICTKRKFSWSQIRASDT